MSIPELTFPAATVLNPNGRSDWLLVCEHASRKIPPFLHNLGLSAEILATHIAYDIGTYEMTLTLAKRLDATVIIANYSRLLIDCNRPLTAIDSIPEQSDGIDIPGNQRLSAAERQFRITRIYQAFHTTVFQTLTKKLAQNRATKLGNIHSFTPMLAVHGEERPWDIGFIYRDAQPTCQLIDYLRSHTDYCVGDNQPYNGFTHKGYTVPAFADAQNLPSFLVEFRQDLIDTPKGIAHWATLFTAALNALTPSFKDKTTASSSAVTTIG